eukprot:TRINITY_DN832_c0_g1_i1.p1 TRINITY_DN832_c0_g1~~TRINITY_DN832_c0_g1_i1.p1  ORF type:complete len:233 (+),score=37.57 TRINITY_DN832_c0_g1_i1:95-700(+)
MGTSIMAVEYDGGVVMGADSRTTTGAYIANRVSDKITPVHDKIACCRSGSAADTQEVSDLVSWYLDMHSTELGEEPEVSTAANLFQKICYHNKNFLLASIICAGWDKHSGGSVYSIALGGTTVREPWAIGGSGSTYIYGYCDQEYRRGMTQSECEAFVQKGLTLAMARDGSSGGLIRLMTIDKNGCQRRMVPGDRLEKFTV